MKINGKEYGLAYTVGAYLEISDMKMKPKTALDVNKMYIYIAVIMSKAYEKRKKLEDPDYEENCLTLDIIKSLDYKFMDYIIKEVDKAFKEGGDISVKIQPKNNESKKNESAVEALA